MLSDRMKDRIRQSAKLHFDENVSMAGFIYKRAEESHGFEVAEEIVEFYCAEQKRLVDAVEREAAANSYERSCEL